MPYILREFSIVFMKAVNVIPELMPCLLNKHPECVFVVVGDFNHSNLKTLLLRFYRNVDIEIRKSRTLEQVYISIP